MGIYIFNWKTLKQALINAEADHDDSDFGKHIIPRLLESGHNMFAYEFDGYWKDVGTLEAYWQANMQLIDLVPEFNLYEAYWKIYTKSEIQPPQFIASGAAVEKCILGEGTEVYGQIYNSVIGSNVTIEEGAIVRDTIIMSDAVVKKGAEVVRSIVAEKAVIGENVKIGFGDDATNDEYPKIYESGLSVVGQKTEIPSDVTIGKNCAVFGALEREMFENGMLASGKNLIIEEEGA